MNKYLMILAIIWHAFTMISAYENSDPIEIMVNKVSPYANPTESYRYYDLPFCQPDDAHEIDQTLGEKLTGNRKMNSLYNAQFGVEISKKQICEKEYSNDALDLFRKAITQNYLFEMFIENIPVGGKIGFVNNNKIFLANHLRFIIYYNPTQKTLVTATVNYNDGDLIDITNPIRSTIPFFYSISWKATTAENVINTSYDSFYPEDNHLFSIINAFVLVNLLILLVWQILSKTETNTTNPHQAADMESNERNLEKNEENGWKTIRIEVFKCPPQRNLLCAAIGSGAQLTLILILVFFMGSFGLYNRDKGSIVTAAVILYAFTSACSGLISARIYKYLGGTGWALNIVLSSCLFPIPTFIISLILNNFAWAINSTTALPFSSILFVIMMWALVTIPLTIIGGITGRVKMDETLVDVGEKMPKIAKNIPKQPLYLRLVPSVFISGLLPFSVLSVEIDYVFSSLWGHKIYTMWGILFLVFVMGLNMTACISIIQTYFQLNARDYRWWWRSFLIGGSTAFYVFLYALYFYIKKSAMVGFLQAAYFVGYTTILCLVIFLVLGTVGFLASMAFVKYLYERSKVEQKEQYSF